MCTEVLEYRFTEEEARAYVGKKVRALSDIGGCGPPFIAKGAEGEVVGISGYDGINYSLIIRWGDESKGLEDWYTKRFIGPIIEIING